MTNVQKERSKSLTFGERLRGGVMSSSGGILANMEAVERQREDVGKGEHFKRLRDGYDERDGLHHHHAAALETVARVDHHHKQGHAKPPTAPTANAKQGGAVSHTDTSKSREENATEGEDDEEDEDEEDGEDEDEDVARLVDSNDNEFVLTRPQGIGQMELHEDVTFISDLIQLVVAASVGGLLVGAVLKQPPIVGYLLAGACIGPGGLNMIEEIVQVDTIAQFGVVFMLMALGADFSPSKMAAVKFVAVLGGGGAVLLFILVGAVVGAAIEGAPGVPTGMFVGGFAAMSSTAVVWKCLSDSQDVHAAHGQVTIGILLMQDVCIGILFATIPTLAAMRHSLLHAAKHRNAGYAVYASSEATAVDEGIPASAMRHLEALASASLQGPRHHPFRQRASIEAHPTTYMYLTYKVAREVTVFAMFAIISYVFAKVIMPKLLSTILRRASATSSKAAGSAMELYQLHLLSICLLATLASEKLHLGLELGAFASGLMVSGTEHSENALRLIEPLKTFFSSVFFSAVGMLMHPTFVLRNLITLLTSLACLLVLKSLLVAGVVRMFGYTWRASCMVGITVSQIGEFGFVLLSRAEYMGLLPFRLYLLLLGTSTLSLIATPLVYNLGRRLRA